MFWGKPKRDLEVESLKERIKFLEDERALNEKAWRVMLSNKEYKVGDKVRLKCKYGEWVVTIIAIDGWIVHTDRASYNIGTLKLNDLDIQDDDKRPVATYSKFNRDGSKRD